MTTTKRELLEEYEAKAKRLHQVFEEAGPELDLTRVKSLDGDTQAKAQAIRAMNDELAALKRQIEELEELERAKESVKEGLSWLRQPSGGVPHPAGGSGAPAPQKSLGEWVVGAAAFQQYVKARPGGSVVLEFEEFEVKALFDEVSGFPPEVTRTGRLVEFPHRPIQVLDLIPTTTTSQIAVAYMEETTSTNTAAEVVEGGVYPEAAFAFTERSSPVRKVAVYLPVTDEVLEDVARVQDIINNRLTFFLRQRLDNQVLNGDGTPPNLRGILNTSGIQTQAKGTDPTPDAIYKAMTKVRVTGRATPGAVVMHPNDWQEVRLLRTADGVYIWGSPSEAGPERIWGLPVVQTEVIPEGTALVGDFRNFSELAVRRGITVEVGFINDDFVKGRKAIRADIRAAFVVYRPAAFCTVTGI